MGIDDADEVVNDDLEPFQIRRHWESRYILNNSIECFDVTKTHVTFKTAMLVDYTKMLMYEINLYQI